MPEGEKSEAKYSTKKTLLAMRTKENGVNRKNGTTVTIYIKTVNWMVSISYAAHGALIRKINLKRALDMYFCN